MSENDPNDPSKEPIEECCRPDFIYGGPFIKQIKVEPFMTTSTPINIQLQGTFKQSFAYYSLKERLPIILTKVIDSASKKGDQAFVQFLAKLKSDLVTNKEYDKFTVDTDDAKLWNKWIDDCDNKRYFNNAWMFTECYVYRKIREGCELSPTLQDWDPFEEQKNASFASSLEPMCVAAEKIVPMMAVSEKAKRKLDFIALLKICLWANKCDLCLTLCEDVNVAGAPGGATDLIDPFQMILDWKDKVLADDSAKAADGICNKAEAMRTKIANVTTLKVQCSCHRLAKLFGAPILKQEEEEAPAVPDAPAEGEEPPKPPPCPAKMVIPQCVLFDIVCDNAGYELFADLCLANFLIEQKIVDKVRLHVKNMPWFVSDVTYKDVGFVINSCKNANFSRTIEAEVKPVKEGETPPPPEPPRVVSSEALRQLGQTWEGYVEDGTFVICQEPYWTYPHCYKDMKKYDYNLYRKLQYASGILFKGDLNYRKLLGDRNVNPYSGLEPGMQGFIPAPIIAVRTVKADLICGMGKGKWEVLNKLDAKWMEKGDYGVIHYCAKAEALKVSDRPCIDYGKECWGGPCPAHTDM